ncbi:hypothetical protein HNQ08_001552 [Deinococcus humi]|uniref:Pyrrolo-quinoline quinone repeat domain-containing protein n=2 Tax=Deinococcus humi TaxID=662880 RepID=A0A7W8JSJ2_9DEIO|nr:hypothetical protein [Deinococcus humi]
MPDLTLEPLWSMVTHQTVPSMAQCGGLLVCPARHSKLIALDFTTGHERWRANVLSPWGNLALSATHAYYLNQYSRLDAFDLRSGTQAWSTELPGTFGWLHADEHSVVAGAWRNYAPLTCLEASTGQRRWTVPLGRERVWRTAIYAPLQAVAVLQETEGRIRWFSLHGRAELQALTLGGLRAESIDFIPTGVFGQETRGLLLRAGAGDFYRLTGHPVSVEHHRTRQDLLSSQLDERDGQVFFLNRQRAFCAYDLQKQRTLVMEQVDHQRADHLPARKLADGTYLLGTSMGTLWHFDAAGKRISRRRVGKRVTTDLFTDGRTIAFGTASGTVLGFQC